MKACVLSDWKLQRKVFIQQAHLKGSIESIVADETAMADDTMSDEAMTDDTMSDEAMTDDTMSDEAIADEVINGRFSSFKRKYREHSD